MAVERFGVTRYGSGSVVHAPIIKAGPWVFATGIRAIGPDGLIDRSVLGGGNPLRPPPKAEREARFIFRRLAQHLGEAGSSLDRVVRLDQYYPTWRAVDPYHVARKEALGKGVAPSTSVLVNRLADLDADMDIQVIATTSDSGMDAEPVRPSGVQAPKESGYAPCLRAGDLIFVAGQLARDATGAIAAEAMVPPGQLWRGTRIKLETDYLVQKRLLPSLEAAGSNLDLILKAQVYLSRPEDFPGFWQVWSAAFNGRVPPTTVVPVEHPGFGTEAATLEVNVIAAPVEARDRIRDVECDVELLGPGMIPARGMNGLLFVAGLMPIDADGLVASARIEEKVPFFQNTVRAQMRDVLEKARKIFAAAGTDLQNVVRALHFHSDLGTFKDAYPEWETVLGQKGVPFAAVEVNSNLFVPGAGLILDLWGYAPDL